MRPVMLDRTHPASGHSTFPLCASRQRTSALIGRTLPVSDHSSRQRPVIRPRRVLTAATDRTLNPASGHCSISVRSLCEPLSFLYRALVAPSDCPYSTGRHSTGGVPNPSHLRSFAELIHINSNFISFVNVPTPPSVHHHVYVC